MCWLQHNNVHQLPLLDNVTTFIHVAILIPFLRLWHWIWKHKAKLLADLLRSCKCYIELSPLSCCPCLWSFLITLPFPQAQFVVHFLALIPHGTINFLGWRNYQLTSWWWILNDFHRLSWSPLRLPRKWPEIHRYLAWALENIEIGLHSQGLDWSIKGLC